MEPRGLSRAILPQPRVTPRPPPPINDKENEAPPIGALVPSVLNKSSHSDTSKEKETSDSKNSVSPHAASENLKVESSAHPSFAHKYPSQHLLDRQARERDRRRVRRTLILFNEFINANVS